MTTNTEFERLARAWLADGPTELADRVLEAALSDVRRSPKRRRFVEPRRALWMPFHSVAFARVAAALVVTAVALGGAYYVIGPWASTAGPSPSVPHSTLPASTATPLATAPRTTLQGRVYDAGGRPVAGATVRATFGSDGNVASDARTDATGLWSISGLPPAPSYCLEVEATIADPGEPGRSGTTWRLYVGASTAVGRRVDQRCVVPDGTIKTIDTHLPAATLVSGTVVDAIGRPLRLTSAGGGYESVRLFGLIPLPDGTNDGYPWGSVLAQTQPDGHFSIWLPRGTWVLYGMSTRQRVGRFSSVTSPITVGADPVTGIRVRFDAPPSPGAS